jgi:hypothetical protein
MSRDAKHWKIARRPTNGMSALEVIVAFTLLSSVLAFATPLVVRHGRLLTAQRDYRLALDELSNQLERLSALPAAELPAAVAQLAPSEFAAARLHGAELKGELSPADVGQRLTLRLSWDEPQRRAAPVTLAAWIIPDGQPSSNPPTRSQQP